MTYQPLYKRCCSKYCPPLSVPSDWWPRTLQIVSDTHFDSPPMARLDLITDDLQVVSASIVHCGDQTENAAGGEDANCIAWLNGLPTSGAWYAVAGNHDLLGRTPVQWAAAYGMPGRDYAVNLGFCHLIVLGCNDSLSPHTIDAAGLAFLDASLTAAGSTPCIIASHFPVYNTVRSSNHALYYDSRSNAWFIRMTAGIWDVLKDHDNAVAWVTGHLHAPFHAPEFVHLEHIGTHRMVFCAASSPYYTNKLAGYIPGEVVPSIYITVFSTDLIVTIRDHLQRIFLRQYVIPYKSGLDEVDPVLHDGFSDDNEEAGADAGHSFHVCDGAGGLHFLDQNGVFSITGGKWRINGIPASMDGICGQQPVLRRCGRTLNVELSDRVVVPATNLVWGFSNNWFSSRVTEHGARLTNVGSYQINGIGGAVVFSEFSAITYAVGTFYNKIIMRSSGCWHLARDDGMAAGQYRLAYVSALYDASLHVKFLNSNVNNDFKLDNFRVYELGSPFDTDFGPATNYIAAPGAGQVSSTATGDFIVEITWQAELGVDKDLMVRRIDDNNTWIVRMSMADNTIKLITVAGGVPNIRDSDAFAWVVGQFYRIVVIMEGNNQRNIIEDLTAGTFDDYNAANVNFQSAETGVKVSHAGTDLACWPRFMTL